MFTYDLKFEEKTAKMKLAGKVDERGEMDEFREAMKEVYASNMDTVEVDLGELTFLTSEALGALLLFRRELTKRDCKIVLLNINSDIMTLFKATRVDQVFGINGN